MPPPSRPPAAASHPIHDRPSSVRTVGDAGLRSISKQTAANTAANTASNTRPPNYQPSNRAAFLARLQTFSDVKLWTPKPPTLSEVEWARQGWSLDAWNSVACKGGCEARIVVRLRPAMKDAQGKEIDKSEDWGQDVSQELVEKYCSMIVNGHIEGCLWRVGGGCKDDIYRIRFGDQIVWRMGLRERYTALMRVKEAFPEKLKAPVGLDVDGLLKDVPEHLWTETPNKDDSVDEDSSPVEPTNSTAALLALTGWTAQTQYSISLATCSQCFAKVGLWLYTSKESVKVLKSQVDASDILTFDLVDLHRSHCPWRDSGTMRAIGSLEGKAGWEVMVELVRGWARTQRREEGVIASGAARNSSRQTDGDEAEEQSLVDSPENLKRRREELEKEDKARESRLKKLKRALSLKKKSKG
ncbi:hypothetical protein LTS18_008492 [Coniosporium uncinatum]|uniref:Uncharacterized protein n=1 Tax=Coniosporium uncinatum TaxID=93489 RepID=A0ACC3DWS0_9PEZI|nr:hypothetical protein LTS18_008492 [Coniosporium uncinatum]